MSLQLLLKLCSLIAKKREERNKTLWRCFENVAICSPQNFCSSCTKFCQFFHFPIFLLPSLFFLFFVHYCTTSLSLPITPLFTLPSHRHPLTATLSPQPSCQSALATNLHHCGRRRPPLIQTSHHHNTSFKPISPPPPLPPIKPSSPMRKGTLFFNKKSKLISFGLLLIFMLYCYSIFKQLLFVFVVKFDRLVQWLTWMSFVEILIWTG